GADAGFMTRLEAFVDVIRSHKDGVVKEPYEIKNAAVKMSDFKDRTILVPPMHPAGTNLFAAAFRGFGMNARALDVETREDFEIGKRYCRGSECIPACSTIGKFISELEKGDIEKPAFFMPTASGPCRFGQYSTLHRIILNRIGRDDVPIFSWSSENAYEGQGIKERRILWNAILMSDILFKLRCKVKPYERNAGETAGLFNASLRGLEKGFEKGDVPLKEFKKIIGAFRRIETVESEKPLVGIVGEIYVRCNPFSNQYIIETIEEAGGEAWLAPISEWILYTSYVEANLYKGKFDLGALLKNRFMKNDEEELYDLCGDILGDRHEPSIEENIAAGRDYFPLEFEGESILTIGRALKFVEQGVDFVINCSPFSCMHGNLTAAVFQQIETKLGVPVINVFYDGEREVNGVIRSVVKNRGRERLTAVETQTTSGL
ncbi:MAG: hypothetical protein FJ088_01845, partial [Deltaproteobacteria bacterium]|nr:hypothetical protein [Deltaproteobacteria bacterium]